MTLRPCTNLLFLIVRARSKTIAARGHKSIWLENVGVMTVLYLTASRLPFVVGLRGRGWQFHHCHPGVARGRFQCNVIARLFIIETYIFFFRTSAVSCSFMSRDSIKTPLDYFRNPLISFHASSTETHRSPMGRHFLIPAKCVATSV